MGSISQSVEGAAVMVVLATINTFALSYLNWIDSFTWQNTLAVFWLSLFVAVMVYVINKSLQPVFIINGEMIDMEDDVEENQ